ncbi:MAG: response regulator [Acidobacteriia bacterium]|nr:response regulator [Terriglobia bacterium]
MSECKPLEALFPGSAGGLVRAIFGETDRWWSLPELAIRAGAVAGQLRRPLTRLRHGGLLRTRRDAGRTWFQADPACPAFAELQSIVTKLTAKHGSSETILVVEDQPATAQITRILLESWGYAVREAHSGAEAIHIFERHESKIDLLLTDVIMPGITGPQLAGELLRRNPALPVVYMSGYPNEEVSGRDAAFLPKPFNPARLSRVIRQELDRAARRSDPPHH